MTKGWRAVLVNDNFVTETFSIWDFFHNVVLTLSEKLWFDLVAQVSPNVRNSSEGSDMYKKTQYGYGVYARDLDVQAFFIHFLCI